MFKREVQTRCAKWRTGVDMVSQQYLSSQRPREAQSCSLFFSSEPSSKSVSLGVFDALCVDISQRIEYRSLHRWEKNAGSGPHSRGTSLKRVCREIHIAVAARAIFTLSASLTYFPLLSSRFARTEAPRVRLVLYSESPPTPFGSPEHDHE